MCLLCSYSALRDNIKKLHDERLMDTESFEWWEEFLRVQDETVWLLTGGRPCSCY